MEGLDLRLRERRGPDRRGGALLELAVAGNHALGDAAEQVRGLELLLDGLERLLGAREVVGREEEEGEVDGGAAERRGPRAPPRRLPPPPRWRRTTPPRPGT